ncbi:MAG: helix-turn-helix transcriptional regulator [Rhodopila sp.]
MTSPSITEPLTLSLDELAVACGISRRHLHTPIKRGLGPSTIKLARRRVIRREAAADWLKSREAV